VFTRGKSSRKVCVPKGINPQEEGKPKTRSKDTHQRLVEDYQEVTGHTVQRACPLTPFQKGSVESALLRERKETLSKNESEWEERQVSWTSGKKDRQERNLGCLMALERVQKKERRKGGGRDRI